jgi:hypothetical protein
MAYESISHARSHRAPFAGLGRAPGYMGNYCSDGMAGPSPGDAGYRALARHASLGNSAKSASTGGGDMLQSAISAFTGGGGGGGGGGAAAGGPDPVAAVASAVSETMKATGTAIDAAMGGPQKRERESRRNLQIAQLTAQAAAGNAAAQVEIARLQAEAAVESARLAGQSGDASTKKMMMIGGGVALLAVIGIGAAIALK